MTLRDWLSVMRDHWRLVVAGLVLGLAVATAVIVLIPRQYSASVTMIVSAVPREGLASEDVSAQRVQTYVELMRSNGLAADVVATMNLNVSADDLVKRITVTSSPETALLTAAVTSDSPEIAIDVANAVGAAFIKKVALLEQPTQSAAAPAWQVKVFEPAAAPAEMVTPRPVLYLLWGAVLGLLAGIVAALLRNWLDLSLKRQRQLERTFHAPVLGIIGRDPAIVGGSSLIYRDPQAPGAETFRRLRANLQLADVDRANKVILVTSAGAGEGKTMVLCNLACALAAGGSTVLVIEADRRQPRAASVFGINRKVGLANVLAGSTRVERVVVRWKEGLDVLPCGSLAPNPDELLGSTMMAALLADVRGRYDVVLVDSSPLLPIADVQPLVALVDGVLLVVPYGAQLARVDAARAALSAMSVRLLGTVMTMVPERQARRGRRNGGSKAAHGHPSDGRLPRGGTKTKTRWLGSPLAAASTTRTVAPGDTEDPVVPPVAESTSSFAGRSLTSGNSQRDPLIMENDAPTGE